MATIRQEQVVEALKTIHDPEIPVDIWNFGLVYGIEIDDEDRVEITMSLTSESCPSAKQIPHDVKTRVEQIAGVKSCDVQVVWEPRWSPQRISPEGRAVLGLDDD